MCSYLESGPAFLLWITPETLICEAIETVTSEKLMCVRAKISYWLCSSCHKGSTCENVTEVVFTLLFASVFISVCIWNIYSLLIIGMTEGTLHSQRLYTSTACISFISWHPVPSVSLNLERYCVIYKILWVRRCLSNERLVKVPNNKSLQ